MYLHRERMVADDYLRHDFFVVLAIGLLGGDHMKKLQLHMMIILE